jgi:hypothetical protein
MLTPETAALALAIARGLIKLAGRMDALVAEAAAVDGPLLIPLPPFVPGPPYSAMVKELRKVETETANLSPDPLRSFRKALNETLAEAAAATDDRLYGKILGFYRKVAPAKADPAPIDPNQEYLKELRRRLGTLNWEDPDLLQAAFVVSAGRDRREVGYAARLGLLIVDVLSEFGAENTGLFVRDPKVAELVSAVLTRFAKPELETFEQWSPFLRHALSSTLNGMLDARGVLQGQNAWLDAVLVALARARDKASEPDDFLVGLLQGDGYRVLIAEGLRTAAEKLGDAGADRFGAIVSDVLLAAVPMVEADDAGFGEFFRAHWADLLRAGVHSVVEHGPELLASTSPILRETLIAMLSAVAASDEDVSVLSSDTVLRMAEGALAAVASNPDLLKASIREPWLAALVGSVAGTLSNRTIRETFSPHGLESIVQDALRAFAAHPELILPRDEGVGFDIVASILKAVAKAESLALRPLATASVTAALEGLIRHPELVGSEYGTYVSATAGALAKRVAARSISSVQAADLAKVIVDAMLRNPVLFARWKDDVATRVVETVLAATGGDPQRLVAGAAEVELTRRVLVAFARHGMGFVENRTIKDLVAQLAKVLDSGLARAGKELGRRLDHPEVPVVIGELVVKLLRGELGDIDPESENFKKAFSALADSLPGRD